MLDHIDLKLTNQCNLNCDYCFVKKEYRKDTSFFDRYDDLAYYITSMNLSGTLPIIMCGGELSLFPEKLKAACIRIKRAERYSDLKISFTIYTNGYNLQPILDLLDEGIINTVNLSWDGLNNSARNKSVSELRFISNMKLISGRKDVVVRTAVTKNNIYTLYNTAKFIEECGVINWEYYFLMDYEEYTKEYFHNQFKEELKNIHTLKKLTIYNFSHMDKSYNGTIGTMHIKKNFCTSPGNFLSIGIDGKVTGCGICSSPECIYSEEETNYHDLLDGYNPHKIMDSLKKCISSDKCDYLHCKNLHCTGCQYTEGKHTYPQLCGLRHIERIAYISSKSQ